MKIENPNYLNILDDLYKRYFLKESFSNVVSSHWEKYSSMGYVNKIDKDYFIKSFGVSNYEKKSPLNSIKKYQHLKI